MDDKVERFVQRTIARAQEHTDRSAYISVRFGNSYRKGSETLASLENIGDRDPAEVIEWAREVCEDNADGDATKAYFDARWEGAKKRFDHTFTPLDDDGGASVADSSGDGSRGRSEVMLARVVAMMAASANDRADRANARNAATIGRVLTFAERAHKAEAEAKHYDLELMSEMADGDRKAEALREIAPALKAVAGKLMGLHPTAIAMLATGQDIPAAMLTDRKGASKPLAADDEEAKRKGLQALRAVAKLGKQHPGLREDPEVIEAVFALLQSGAEEAAEEPADGSAVAGAALSGDGGPSEAPTGDTPENAGERPGAEQ